MSAPARMMQRLALPPVLVLLVAACASTPAPDTGEPAPTAELDLAAFATLDPDRATCVADLLLAESQQMARRIGRSLNESPQAWAERDAWFARRVEANRMQDLMRALSVNASSSPSAQQWANQVLANAVYFNPGATRMQTPFGTWVGPTARQYDDLVTGGPQRRALMARNVEGFRTLADAHRRALGALVAARGDATDPELALAARRVAEQVRRDPVLEVVYQEEFVLEYDYGTACGPGPRISVAESLGNP